MRNAARPQDASRIEGEWSPLVDGTGPVVAIHAHPDDETLYTGGTLARCAAAGRAVHVLTCTLGEEGEVIGEEAAHLVAAEADQLGGYRYHELAAALRELGLGAPDLLGGAGTYRDSGMDGSTAHPRAFAGAEEPEIVSLLADRLAELQPEVVLIYDEGGTYGHPDHIHAHKAGLAAVREAMSRPEARNADAPAVYWMMCGARRLAEAFFPLDKAAGDLTLVGLPPQWRRCGDELFAVEDGLITDRVVLTAEDLGAKIAALRCHRTQLTVVEAGERAWFALSNNIVQPVLDIEEYRRVDTDPRGATDR